jgi:hypothetical protein
MRNWLACVVSLASITTANAVSFPCQTPEVCNSLWVAVHDIGSSRSFFNKDGRQLDAGDIHAGDKVISNRDINVRTGPAKWGEPVFVLGKEQQVIVAEVRALPINADKSQLWIRITDKVSDIKTESNNPQDEKGSNTKPQVSQPCDLTKSVTSAHKRDATIDFGGKSLPVKESSTLSFQPEDSGLILVTETDDIEIENGEDRYREIVAEKTASVPKDTCDKNVVITSITTATEGGRIVSSVGFKGEQWKCRSADLPCPTTTDWGRWCRQESKDIEGEGTGVVSIITEATPSQDKKSIQINTTSSTDFHLDTKTQILGGLVGGLLGGVPGIAVFVKIGSDIEKEAQGYTAFRDSKVIDPAKLGNNELWSPVVKSASFSHFANPSYWTINFGPVSTSGSVMRHGIVLRVVREQEKKRGTACFLQSQVQAE